MQVFLGFVNFYRRFIKGYSHIMRPLTDLLQKGDPSVGTPAARRSSSRGHREYRKPSACRRQASIGSQTSELLIDMPGGTAMLGMHGMSQSTSNGNRKGARQPERAWYWNLSCEKAFKWLKQAFTCMDILAHFNPDKHIRVETDTS